MIEFNENNNKNVLKLCQCETSPICPFKVDYFSGTIKINSNRNIIHSNDLNCRYDVQISIFRKGNQENFS